MILQIWRDVKHKQSVSNKGIEQKDREQFERYRKVLEDNVPKKFEDFLELKYNNKERYGTLKHAYRVANQYESNSGSMDPMKIVELHDKAVECKAKFTGKARRKANIGIMEIDNKTYVANSQINVVSDSGYVNFPGDKKTIVTQPSKRRFETLVIGHDRKVDSEYKLFEHAAMIAEDGKAHEIVMLSEKSMCESCQFVMLQFKEKYPNVKVNVVSHKREKSIKNKNHNIVFEFDTKRRI